MRAAAPAPLGVSGLHPRQFRRLGSSRNITRLAGGGPSHVQAKRQGRCWNPDALGGALSGVPASSSGYHRKGGRHDMNLGDFIDTFKDAIAQRVVESYPPLYRPSENGHRLPRLLRKPLGAQADAITGRGPLPRRPPGHHRRRRDGHRQDLHRRRRRTSGGLQAGSWSSARPTWCPSGRGRWR